MAKIIQMEPALEGEETLSNTKNLWQAGLFCVTIGAMIGLVAWITLNVGTMVALYMLQY